MFLFGGNLKGGLVGPNPDLVNLERGDVKWHTDFRQVYATILDQWMGADSATLFGKSFEHVAVF